MGRRLTQEAVANTGAYWKEMTKATKTKKTAKTNKKKQAHERKRDKFDLTIL